MITIKDGYQSNIIVQCKDVGISVFGIHPRAIYYVEVAIMYLYMIHIKVYQHFNTYQLVDVQDSLYTHESSR